MIFKEYFQKELEKDVIYEAVKTIEAAVDIALENSKNLKGAIDYVEKLAKKDSFVRSNKKKIENILKKIPKNMFVEENENLYDGIDLDEIDEIYEDEDDLIEEDDWDEETDKVSEAAVRVRIIRRGKAVTKKRSNKSGYKMMGGREVKMSARERISRKRAQRRGAKKRKAHMSQIQRKRKISFKRRSSMGLR